MTDKQLALLLRQIAGRIRALALEIEPLIESGETVTNKIIDWSSATAALNMRTVEETRLAAVQRILDLAADIEDEAELLKRETADPES